MEASRSEKILLVVPPFWSAAVPYLGVGQLKANLERAGHRTEVLYLNFLFSQRIGLQACDYVATFANSILLGEFVFSAALFGQEPGHVDDYLNDVLAGTDSLRWIKREFADPPATVLTRWREEAIRFCDGEGLAEILDRDAWLVGFSSSFQQNCAALALMDRLKRVRPDVAIVMGGANCEEDMGAELMARFPSIDYVGFGECDHSLVALADALAVGKTGHGIPGMRSRETPAVAMPSPQLTSDDLDDLPYPDFDDFFAQRGTHGLEEPDRVALAMETARGCWWGAKHHCTFCGLNAESMGFRSKSPRRVLEEIDWLVDRHGPLQVRMADNIVDMKYFKTVLPQLARWRRTKLFYETKANLTRDQVRLFAEARVNRIQPGLESLSDESLRLMDKGSTKMQNLQLLRWSAEYGVGVDWNYLIGFPGENDDEFTEIADEIELLHHLEPPADYGVLRIMRFSPYFNKPDEYGLAPITPNRAYRHVYPFPPESLARIAYYFKSDLLDRKANSPGAAIVQKMILRWKKAHKHSFLFAIPRRKSLLVIDTRHRSRRWIHRLTGLRRAVYEYGDRARSLAEITREVGANATPKSIEEAVESLVRDRLMLPGGQRYLSLGIEPGRTLTFENAPARLTAEPISRPPVPLEHRASFLLAPRKAIYRLARRLRYYRHGVRDRWTRHAVWALVRLLEEPEARGDAAPRKSVLPEAD